MDPLAPAGARLINPEPFAHHLWRPPHAAARGGDGRKPRFRCLCCPGEEGLSGERS